MRSDFKNVLQLLEYYSDEAKCKELLALRRWAGAPVCPHCNSTKTPYVTKAGYKCSDNTCYKKFTVTVGTIFENSKIKLRYWFAAIYLVTAHKKGISSHQLARDLGITQKTAWFILHRVREMLKDKKPSILKGVVEVDETFIGGKDKGVRGRGGDKTVVFGTLERQGKVVTHVVPNTQKVTLLPIIEATIKEGTTIYSDENKSYQTLNKKYVHDFVKHGHKEYVKNKVVHTNTIEGFWSLLKRGVDGIYHQVSPKHLQAYCNEYAYRYNTRHQTDNDRFFESLWNSCNFRLTYKRLTQNAQKD